MLQQSLQNAIRALGLNKRVLTLVTQTLVDPHDPAFQNPTKPIGAFMSESQARAFEAKGWQVMEDAGRGWRRVIASPKPLDIIELGAIRTMSQSGYIVIACGGGGIPVIRNHKGELQSAPNSVIDKDLASSLLAARIGADLFIISTGVPKVSLNFQQPTQKDLDHLSLNEAKTYLAEGHFGVGSMRPKIEAVIAFLEQGGPQALITNPSNLSKALMKEEGTWVTPL